MFRHNAEFILVLVILGLETISSFANTSSNEEPPNTTVSPTTHIPPGFTVDCYSCVGCPQIKTDTAVKNCEYSLDPVKSKTCVKFGEILRLPINGKNHSWAIRGCATERGSCENLRTIYAHNPHVALEYCTECEGDKCNSASRSMSDIFFAFFAVIFVPLIAKYIMS